MLKLDPVTYVLSYQLGDVGLARAHHHGILGNINRPEQEGPDGDQ